MTADNKAKLALAFQCLADGKPADAQRVATAVLKRAPRDAQALYLLGMSFCFTRRYADAIDVLRQATALDADNVQALYNLGVAHGEIRQHHEAIAVYRMTLDKDPGHIFSLHNLGMELVNTGQLAEAIPHLRRVQELCPTHAMVTDNLVRAECRLLPMDNWPALCTQALAVSPVSAENRYIILIQRAMAEWATGDMPSLSATLAAAADARPEAKNARIENTLRYEDFLNKLLIYRHAHPHLYADAAQPLFLVGDSHSLSYAGSLLTLDGVARKISSHLIVGAKAWHISSGIPNPYAMALSTHVNRLPAGASLICAFGEIDCRPDDGILPYWKKTGGALQAIVAEQVTRYIAALTACATGQALRLIFLSVPAPHQINRDSRDVTALFNAALEKHVLTAGHRYVDLYKITLGNDKCSHGELNIDAVHLKPEALTAALG